MAELIIHNSNGVETEIGSFDFYKLGMVSYSSWVDYPWKNELSKQMALVIRHAKEIFDDCDVGHNPHHMLSWAISLASICMRRLIECRLVSDEFLKEKLPIYKIKRKKGARQLESFIGVSGGRVYENFDLRSRVKAVHDPKYIADKLLHARIVAVISSNERIPDGLLIASDWQSKESLFHFSLAEFEEIVLSFLRDDIQSSSDSVDMSTGIAHSVRTRRRTVNV